MVEIEEAEKFPELGEFLRVMNSERSMVETAKCDAWATTELSPEEEVYDASHKFVSYVDVVFSNTDLHQSSVRESLPAHEQFVRKLVELLQRVPETPSAVEVCVRRGYFVEDSGVRGGFYFTFYVRGDRDEGARARRKLAVCLELMGNA